MVQPLHLRQQVMAQHRRDGHRHQHRGQDGHDVGNAQRREQAAFDARQREERHEHQHDDHCGVHDARAHLDAGLAHHFHRGQGIARRTVLLEPSHDVLDVDHRVVDQLPDGDGQAAERHHVDRLPEQLECQRGDCQREWNRHQRNDRGTRGEQKREQHDGHHDRAVAQCLAHVADGRLDEVGLTEQHLRRREARWQTLLQFAQCGFDGAGELHGVGGGLLLHAHDHRGRAVVSGVAALHGGCVAHLGHLAQQDGAAVLPRHGDALKILDAVRARDVPDQVFAAVEVDKATARVAGEAAQRLLDLRE
ncbi:hypothetical protein D3C86_1299710 [compost metagenome]